MRNIFFPHYLSGEPTFSTETTGISGAFFLGHVRITYPAITATMQQDIRIRRFLRNFNSFLAKNCFIFIMDCQYVDTLGLFVTNKFLSQYCSLIYGLMPAGSILL